MKKALSFAVALGLVAGLASYASAATVDFHGDARWRGLSQVNEDGSDANVDSVKGMDQRYRLVANVSVNDDLMVGFRMNMLDGMFGNNRSNDGVNCTTGAPAPIVDVINNATGAAGADGIADPGQYTTTCSQDGIMVDRAYMKIKMLGGTYLIGRQNASWGNKFLGWGNGVDRLKAVYKGGGATYGGYLQKNSEAGDNNDSDTFGGFYIKKSGDTKWGVLPNYIVNHSAAAVAAGTDTGFLVDFFFNTKIGNIGLMSEIVYFGGDMLESVDGDAKIGGFVGASTTMDALSVKGLVAFYMNNEGNNGAGRDCDNDFAPSLLIGTCQESAIIDFGGTTALSTVANPGLSDDMTYLIGAGADLKVNDKLTVGTLVGYLHASDNYTGITATGADLNLIEVDLTASYVLAKGVTYKAGIAYGMWDGLTVADDELLSFSNSIAVKW